MTLEHPLRISDAVALPLSHFFCPWMKRCWHGRNTKLMIVTKRSKHLKSSDTSVSQLAMLHFSSNISNLLIFFCVPLSGWAHPNFDRCQPPLCQRACAASAPRLLGGAASPHWASTRTKRWRRAYAGRGATSAALCGTAIGSRSPLALQYTAFSFVGRRPRRSNFPKKPTCLTKSMYRLYRLRSKKLHQYPPTLTTKTGVQKMQRRGPGRKKKFPAWCAPRRSPAGTPAGAQLADWRRRTNSPAPARTSPC